jgi:hypothetical protein
LVFETKLNVQSSGWDVKYSFSHFCVWTFHQNSLQCLSLSHCKRNQEPVDISHFLIWPFHISMFRRFSIFHRQLQRNLITVSTVSLLFQPEPNCTTNEPTVSTEKL